MDDVTVESGQGQVVEQTVTQDDGNVSIKVEGSEETATKSWFESLNKDLREHTGLGKYKDVDLDKFVESHLNLQSKIGAKGILLPDPKNPEDVERFHKDIADLAKDGYDFSGIENEVLTDEMKVVMEDIAKTAGLTPHQAKKVLERYGDLAKSGVAEQEAKKIEAENQLRKEWGADFEKNLDRAKKIYGSLAEGDEGIQKFFEEHGNNAAVIKAFANVAANVSDAVIERGSSQAGVSPKEAEFKIKQMLADKAHPLNDKTHPLHREAVEEQQRLAGIAWAEDNRSLSDLLRPQL